MVNGIREKWNNFLSHHAGDFFVGDFSADGCSREMGMFSLQ
jgi:hypothetical protein